MRFDNELLAEAKRRDNREVEKAENVIAFILFALLTASLVAAAFGQGKSTNPGCPPEFNQYKNLICK